MVASGVILAVARLLDRSGEHREMVDGMLAWTIARHEAWFWNGLQGSRLINRY